MTAESSCVNLDLAVAESIYTATGPVFFSKTKQEKVLASLPPACVTLQSDLAVSYPYADNVVVVACMDTILFTPVTNPKRQYPRG